MDAFQFDMRHFSIDYKASQCREEVHIWMESKPIVEIYFFYHLCFPFSYYQSFPSWNYSFRFQWRANDKYRTQRRLKPIPQYTYKGSIINASPAWNININSIWIICLILSGNLLDCPVIAMHKYSLESFAP